MHLGQDIEDSPALAISAYRPRDCHASSTPVSQIKLVAAILEDLTIHVVDVDNSNLSRLSTGEDQAATGRLVSVTADSLV